MMNVRATRTDGAGNGYYTADNGDIYYGNAQNGYLVETDQTKRNREQREAWNHASGNQNAYSQATTARTSTGSSILEMLFMKGAAKVGLHLGNMLGTFLGTVVPFLFKLILVFLAFPSLLKDYVWEFILYNGYMGCRLLSLAGFTGIFAMVVYGVYRKMKGKKSITKAVFWAEFAALTGIYYLNYQNDGLSLLISVYMAFFFAYALKVMSTWLEMIVYRGYCMIHSR